MSPFHFLSYQSVGDGSLDIGAGVEDSHGVDRGRDTSLMGQPVWKRRETKLTSACGGNKLKFTVQE